MMEKRLEIPIAEMLPDIAVAESAGRRLFKAS
jgi:hypothetical protein